MYFKNKEKKSGDFRKQYDVSLEEDTYLPPILARCKQLTRIAVQVLDKRSAWSWECLFPALLEHESAVSGPSPAGPAAGSRKRRMEPGTPIVCPEDGRSCTLTQTWIARDASDSCRLALYGEARRHCQAFTAGVSTRLFSTLP